MYKQTRNHRTSIVAAETAPGEHIETKIERILTNQEPITDGAPVIFTERADGVLPEYNVRTDRFELAVTAMDSIAKDSLAKRKAAIEERKKKEAPESAEPPKTEGNPQT